jgi:hypothetical protein
VFRVSRGEGQRSHNEWCGVAVQAYRLDNDCQVSQVDSIGYRHRRIQLVMVMNVRKQCGWGIRQETDKGLEYRDTLQCRTPKGLRSIIIEYVVEGVSKV